MYLRVTTVQKLVDLGLRLLVQNKLITLNHDSVSCQHLRPHSGFLLCRSEVVDRITPPHHTRHVKSKRLGAETMITVISAQ